MQAKITAQQTQSQSRFVIKFSPEELKEMHWEKQDIIRVISKKKENKIILTKVKSKYKKQVAYTLTSTGRGDFAFSEGLFVAHTAKRFAGKPENMKSAKIDVKKVGNRIEIEMPQEVFCH